MKAPGKALKSNKGDADFLDNCISLYRRVSAHLSYGRTHFPQSEVCEYLNGLVSKSHNFLYKPEKIGLSAVFKFYRLTIPEAIVRNYRYLLLSTFLFAAAMVYSWHFTAVNPENSAFFLPAGMADSISGGELGAADWNSPIMSGIIMTNNIRVAFMAFALGIIPMGLGTAYVLLVNGLLLGSLSALAVSHGQSLTYWSLIIPHGVMELMAIFISGGAGLIVGTALLRPGIHSRKDALIMAAKEALKLMGIVVPMLIAAGLIEGFFTPSGLHPVIKIAAGAATGILMLFYFSINHLLRG